MPQFYNISFTTRKEIISYDSKGKESGRRKMDMPVTMNMLPLATAQSYKGCDNFKQVEFVETQPHRGRRTSMAGIGNGTKDPQRDKYLKAEKSSKSKFKSAMPPSVDKHKAAKTGDMTGAIND